MTDFKALVAKGRAEGRATARRSLAVITLESGKLLAICETCPKYHCDIRRAEHPVFHQSYKTADAAQIPAWWEAHQCTDLHKYYLNPRREDAPIHLRRAAQERGYDPPKGAVIPFPNGIDRRLIK